VAIGLAFASTVATWAALGDLSEANGYSQMFAPPFTLDRPAEIALALVGVIASVGLFALVVRSCGWGTAILLTVAGVYLGGAGRVLTATTVGANIGGGLVLLTAPIVPALLAAAYGVRTRVDG
jgi:hypothetical protein